MVVFRGAADQLRDFFQPIADGVGVLLEQGGGIWNAVGAAAIGVQGGDQVAEKPSTVTAVMVS